MDERTQKQRRTFKQVTFLNNRKWKLRSLGQWSLSNFQLMASTWEKILRKINVAGWTQIKYENSPLLIIVRGSKTLRAFWGSFIFNQVGEGVHTHTKRRSWEASNDTLWEVHNQKIGKWFHVFFEEMS